MTKETFIEKAKKVHGDKYDYSKVEYINSSTKVCIICPEHGEFWQEPSSHLRGYNCPKCANKKRGHKDSIEAFIEKAKKVHGDKYDYSKVKYVNASTKVCIICPKHGEFMQIPSAHLNGQGCPNCAGRNCTNEKIIEKFKKVHGNKYDYLLVNFEKVHNKVTIICPIHGKFEQTPSKHILGQGCPICAKEKRIEEHTLTQDEFVERSMNIHNNFYSYEHTKYKHIREKVIITCPKHGDFKQYPFEHLNGLGCPKCGMLISNGEDEIYNYLKTITDFEIIKNDRKALNGKEIDIYIPEKKIGIEYNGLKWHSEEFGKDRHYHLDRLEIANNKGIKLIQIFEDEYLLHKKIVLNKIKYLVNAYTGEKIMARKCTIKEINQQDAKVFLNYNHIQGYGKCSLSLGCFYNDRLIGIMSFLDEKNGNYQLIRFATDNTLITQGIGGKLFKYFIKKYNPNIIKTFADRRWTLSKEDNLYTKIGFKLDKVLKPDYRYVNPDHPTERIHKFNFRKRSVHRKYRLPMSMSETQMAKEIGLYKIWDCGLLRYIWTKENRAQ